jgi:hypothetical protein
VFEWCLSKVVSSTVHPRFRMNITQYFGAFEIHVAENIFLTSVAKQKLCNILYINNLSN